MSVSSRIILIVCSIFMLVFMLYKIRKKRIYIHYAIFWTFFVAVLTVLCMCPQIFLWMAEVLDVEVPLHLLIMGLIFLLVIKSFNDTVKISELEYKLGSLVQDVAISRTVKEKEQDEK